MSTHSAGYITTVATLFVLITSVASPTYAQQASPADKQDEQSSQTAPLPSAPSTGIDLTVSPAFINLITDPGKPVTTKIKIVNNSNIIESLTTRLVKFRPSDNGSEPVIEDVEEGDEFATWLTLSPATFTLAPRETETVEVRIAPPASAALGYYYAVVFQRTSEAEGDNIHTLVSGAPAVSILLEVKTSKAQRELQITDVTTDKLFYEYLPVQFDVKIKNTGNIHIIPVGNVYIDWGRKKDISVLNFNEGRGNILPDTERIYSVIWDAGMITRNDGKTSWDITKLDQFRMGRYTAHVLVIYDDGQRDIPLEAEISFWVIPWKILTVVGVAGVLILLGVRSLFVSSLSTLRKPRRK